MKLEINGPFISRKTGINWEQGGMTKERYKSWSKTLENAVEKHKKEFNWLKDSLKQGKKLYFKLSIWGKPQRIKQLDIHDALAQIIDEITNCLFPKENGKPTPQTEDRHFWKVEAEKYISDKERVKIEINEMGI